MKKHLIFLSIFILAAVAGYSQRGGGGSRAHQGQTGQRQGQQGSWGQQGQQQRGTRGNAGDSERQRARINSQQKKQLGECSNAADGVRKQAQKMSRTSGNQFNATESRQQFNQMQEQVRTMEQQHKRLMEVSETGKEYGPSSHTIEQPDAANEFGTCPRQSGSAEGARTGAPDGTDDERAETGIQHAFRPGGLDPALTAFPILRFKKRPSMVSKTIEGRSCRNTIHWFHWKVEKCGLTSNCEPFGSFSVLPPLGFLTFDIRPQTFHTTRETGNLNFH
ncbi:MAG: hypothetical protein P8Z37_17150 [Acidobacteriota bacterium]